METSPTRPQNGFNEFLRKAALAVLRVSLRVLYRVEMKGLEHFAQAGDRVLVIANHASFLDAILLAVYLPERLSFAVNTGISHKWWVRPALRLVEALPIDTTSPFAAKALIDLIRQGRKCMIFPEGRITTTGALMKIYEGPGLIADRSGAAVLPVRIDGTQYTPFSRLRGKVRIRLFPKITLTVLPPQRFNIDPAIQGRKRRQMASAKLSDVMSQMMFDSSDVRRTLFSALLGAKEIHGRRHVVAEDNDRKKLAYGGFVMRSFILGRALTKLFAAEPALAIMLPNSVTTAVTFFALQAFGRVPVMLNFAAGGPQMAAACRLAQAKTVITSRRFIEVGKLEGPVQDLADAGIRIFYLEDIATRIGAVDKIFGLFASFFPKLVYRYTRGAAGPDSRAVILFTSGSEGSAKGVALSHENIIANICQIGSRVDFGPQDLVLNVLPMFHSFGLTGGTLLPILSGIKTFYYPSPLHYRIVPELIYEIGATAMFGTDTFLSGYAKFANPYDMNSLRFIFAGGERLKEDTRRIYADKFGVRLLQGYGATEMSPVIAINTPMQHRPGTVGKLLPGLEYRLAEVPGITEGGALCLKGPNVMLGYLSADAPGKIQPPPDGWYDTGDIVTVDDEGFITIKGRTRRFAKIGGEMVSLAVVEDAVALLWPENNHAAISIPDEKKGEQIVLLTDRADASRDDLLKHFRAQKLAELALPRQVVVIDELPLLGTGKIDHHRAKLFILERQVAPPALAGNE